MLFFSMLQSYYHLHFSFSPIFQLSCASGRAFRIANFALGLRAGELAALRFSDFTEDELILQRSEVENHYIDDNGIVHRDGFKIVPYLKKRKKGRNIPLTESGKTMLAFIRQENVKFGFSESDWVFIQTDSGERHHGSHLQKTMTYACKEAGITPKSNHKIRKTFISSLFESGDISITAIRDIAGHEDAMMTLKVYGKTVTPRSKIRSEMETILPDITAFSGSKTPVGVSVGVAIAK